MVSVQVGEVPIQAPLQPVKVIPGSGVAVRVTTVPAMKDAVQTLPLEPQVMAAGLVTMLPLLLRLTMSLGAAVVPPVAPPPPPAPHRRQSAPPRPPRAEDAPHATPRGSASLPAPPVPA